MPSFVTEVVHALGKEQALRRLVAFVEDLHLRYQGEVSDLEGQWNENQLRYGFKTRGLHIRGTLTVEDTLARVDCQVPFAALLFRGMIEREVRSQLEKMLNCG